VCRVMLVLVVETPAMIVTSLHMEVARPVTSHVVTASTEAGMEMRLEMIRGGWGEEARPHQHPVTGVSLGMEVDIGHPLVLLVQVSRHRGWYRGPWGAWELDHPRAGLTRAPVAAGQSSRELTPGVSLDGASVPGEEGGLEPIGRGDHAAVWRQTGPVMGDGGAVVTPGGLEEDAGGGAAMTGGRGAGEQRGALAGGELAAGDEVTRQAGPGEELRLETAVTQAEGELIRHLIRIRVPWPVPVVSLGSSRQRRTPAMLIRSGRKLAPLPVLPGPPAPAGVPLSPLMWLMLVTMAW